MGPRRWGPRDDRDRCLILVAPVLGDHTFVSPLVQDPPNVGGAVLGAGFPDQADPRSVKQDLGIPVAIG